MSGALGLLQLFILSVALLAGVVAIVVALSYPHLRPRLSKLAPARRARLLTALSLAPLGVALLQTGLFFLPGLLGMIWPELDHCLAHAPDGHMHLCLAHPPGSAGAWFGWLIVLGVVLGIGRPLMTDLMTTWRSARMIRQLIQTADPSHTRTHRSDLRVIDVDVPIAVATAVGAQVLVSSAMVKRLSPELLDAVIAHEHAHLRRKDPWRRVLAMVLSAGHLPKTRRAILDDLELACEQASDQEAAEVVGSRLQVAEALLAVARAMSAQPFGATSVAFSGSSIEARVEALLGEPLKEGSMTAEIGWLLATGALALALASPGHHAVEHLIELLAG